MADRRWGCLSCDAALGSISRDRDGVDALNLRRANVLTVMVTDRVTVVICQCGASRTWRGGRVVVPRSRCATVDV